MTKAKIYRRIDVRKTLRNLSLGDRVLLPYRDCRYDTVRRTALAIEGEFHIYPELNSTSVTRIK